MPAPPSISVRAINIRTNNAQVGNYVGIQFDDASFTVTDRNDIVGVAVKGGAPTGPAGGELGGAYPNPTVNHGSAANTACAGNDARLSDSRIPTGAAGGYLTGTYPNPGISPLVVQATAVYPVYVGGPYATIGDAITQAVTDGHSDANNGALVLISPKVGGWMEDVACKAGVHLQGVGGSSEYAVRVVGKVSFTPAAAAFQIVHVDGLYIQPGVGKPCVELIGANVGDLYVENCVLSKSENTAPNVSINGNVGSNLFLRNCIGNSAGSTAYGVVSGTCQATNCDISSSTAVRGALIGSAGLARFFGVNLVASGDDVVNVASGGAYQFSNVPITQVTANKNGIIQAGVPPFPTGLLFFCLMNVPAGAGYAIKGTGVVSHASNVFTANVKYQVPGLTLNPLAIAPVATP